MSSKYFDIYDYGVFLLSLAFSAGIGVYFACFGNKQQSTAEYLYGSKQMKAVPVGLSLYSSAISSIAIIGIPVEVYMFGMQYVTGVLGLLFLPLLVSWIVLPIFCGNLNIKTPYEYFELRFGKQIRTMTSVIQIIQSLLLPPVILYATATSLSQVTQLSLYLCTICIGGICVAYTAFGGYKTVVWTDSLQATLMLLSCLFVSIIAINKAGGIAHVWNVSEAGNRTTMFNMDPNPFQRMTFWSAVFGTLSMQLSHSGCSAIALQRFMSLPKQSDAQICAVVGALGTILITVTGGLTGLGMYALYKDCDPVTSKEVGTPNQLVPYLVLNTIEYIPGFSGFFMAGILSAALSTLSSELNIIGALIYYDIIMAYFHKKWSKINGATFIKTIVLIVGIIHICGALCLQNAAHVFDVALSVFGITLGAKLGTILLGILFPKVTSKGAFCGIIASLVIMAWISFGSQYYDVSPLYRLELSVENCSKHLNVTISRPRGYEEEPFFVYKLCNLYFSVFGTLITVIVAVIVSYLTGTNDVQKMDQLLIAPFLRTHKMAPELKQNGVEL